MFSSFRVVLLLFVMLVVIVFRCRLLCIVLVR